MAPAISRGSTAYMMTTAPFVLAFVWDMSLHKIHESLTQPLSLNCTLKSHRRWVMIMACQKRICLRGPFLHLSHIVFFISFYKMISWTSREIISRTHILYNKCPYKNVVHCDVCNLFEVSIKDTDEQDFFFFFKGEFVRRYIVCWTICKVQTCDSSWLWQQMVVYHHTCRRRSTRLISLLYLTQETMMSLS